MIHNNFSRRLWKIQRSWRSVVEVPAKRRKILIILLATFPLAASAQVKSDFGNLMTMEMRGSIGRHSAGVNLLLRNRTEIVSAHYFYASNGTNLPLAGKVSRQKVVLAGPGDVAMRLHFVTCSSVPARPLSFYTATGLQGTWTKGAVSLPVKLGFDVIYEGVHIEPWYGGITQEPDSVFEAHARQFLEGALSGHRAETAGAVSFPLHVGTETIRSKVELYARWNQIFTPQGLAILRTAVPHEMFIHNGEAMAADGAVWFNGKGAVLLQLPSATAH